jgi:hypothetical protein
MLNTSYLRQMAKEWAREIGRLDGDEQIIAKHTIWGFGEVERGRNPDVILKEVLTRIKNDSNGRQPSRSDGPTPAPSAAPSSKSN